MFGRPGFVALCLSLATVLFYPGYVHAQAAHPRPLITQSIDEASLVVLGGNHRPEAIAVNDRGLLADNFPMQHMLLQLRRSPEQEAALQQFMDELHTQGSPTFHQWITAQQFGAQFGLAKQDLDIITRWLESHGFQVNVIYPSGVVIDFSGTAGQVRRTFHTEMHALDVNGEKHIANMTDPRIPAAIAPAVAGIVSLHDFRPHAMNHLRRPSANFTFSSSEGTTYALVPADLATIYNLNPVFQAGYSGQGQTIALIEDTDVFTAADWTTFRSQLGLSGYTATFTQLHPPSSGTNNCGAPGVIAPNDAEAILDGEWASAAAPSAAIEMAACADTTTTFGGLIAVQNLINAATAPPAIMSISYGQCETVNGAAANEAFRSTYQQAVAEGVSVFVAAGDSGATACDNSAASATHGIGANAFASTAYNVAVGGTDFSDTYSNTNSTYWNSSNTSAFGSAISYIPEIPWNDSCAGVLLSNNLGYSPTYGPNSLCNDPNYGSFFTTTVAGGGGPSGCATGIPSIDGVVSGSCAGWPKPSWQSLIGNPNDGVRDTPDVSLFAADGLWSHYYVFCWSDTAGGGAACTGDPSTWSGAGGTSFASPIMAGIQALINQKNGGPQGNPNPAYYQLAAGEYGSAGSSSCNSSNGNGVASACVFYDVTEGDMDVDCTGAANCYLDGAAYGVLSTSDNSYQPAYAAATGWDFATGIGSVNAANLVNHWPGSAPYFLLSTAPANLSITQGTSGSSTITVTPQNGFNGSATLSVSGLPSGVTAAFSVNPATTTSLLTLTASATAGTGPVTLTVTGTSGSLTETTTLSLMVNTAGDFALSASPVSVMQGTSGTSTITISPQSGFIGSVNLSASNLPSGVTASFSPNPATNTSTMTLSASATATTGNATLTITGISGTLTRTTTLALTVVQAPNPSFPPTWYDVDVGSVGAPGSAGYAGGVYTVKSAGSTIYGTADGMHFAYQPLSGDGTIVARVVAVQGSTYPQAGVMIRESLNPGSTHAYITYEPYPGPSIYFYSRSSTGGNTTASQNSAISALPYWVKLVRSGNTFTGFASLDAVNWTQVGNSQTIAMAQNVFIGLAVSANDGGGSSLVTATFDSVSLSSAAAPAPVISSVSANAGAIGSSVVISGSGFGATQGNSMVLLNGSAMTVNTWSANSINVTIPAGATSGPMLVSVAPSMNDSNAVPFTVSAQALPSPWLDQDIGSVSTAGSAAYANGVFTVKASGQWIYSTADGLHLVYQPLVGDGTIVARVVSAQGSTYPQAGVMMRETLSSGSTHAFVAYEPYPGPSMYLYSRNGTNSTTTYQSAAISSLPYWVKLVRSGSSFSGYISADGASWTQVGSTQSLSMAQSFYIGLAVSANNNSAVATATFDNVSVTSAGSGPNFTLAASPNSVSVAQGASATSTITVTPENSFSGTVSLAASGLPSGVMASFSPNPATNTSTLTLSANGTAATGTFNVTITGMASGLMNTTAVSLTITVPSTLPSTWSDADVGSVGAPGSAGYAGGVYTVKSAGSTIYGTADGMHFAYQPLSGDGTIVARVLSVQGSTYPQAGVMIRESLNPGSTHAYITYEPYPGPSIYFYSRSSTGGGTASEGSSAISALPYWVKLVRSGNTFTGSASLDGVNWTQVGSSQTIAMAQNVYIGLAVSANTGGGSTLVTATFDSVSLSSAAAPAPVISSVSANAGAIGSSVVISGSGFGATQGNSVVLLNGAAMTVNSWSANSISVTVPAGATSGPMLVSVAPSMNDSNAVPFTVSALPSPWLDGDIGSVSTTGSAAYSSGVFTVKASGQWIYSTADGMHFVYQPLVGDGTIVARVVSAQGSTYPQAGVMIRETLSAGSTHAYVAYEPYPGPSMYLYSRNGTNSNTAYQSAAISALPYWVKLVRSGSSFSGYISADGVSWTQVGSSQSLSMAQSVYIGLAVSANNNSAVATATFDNVSVK